jgi:hypothetical protein
LAPVSASGDTVVHGGPAPTGNAATARRLTAAAALALAAAFAARAPASLLAAEWRTHRAGAPPDPLAGLHAVAARAPVEPIGFVTDSADPDQIAYRLYLVQYAAAPRPLVHPAMGNGDLPRPRFAIAWLSAGTSIAAVPAARGMRVVEDAGAGFLLVEAPR